VQVAKKRRRARRPCLETANAPKSKDWTAAELGDVDLCSRICSTFRSHCHIAYDVRELSVTSRRHDVGVFAKTASKLI